MYLLFAIIKSQLNSSPEKRIKFGVATVIPLREKSVSGVLLRNVVNEKEWRQGGRWGILGLRLYFFIWKNQGNGGRQQDEESLKKR